MLAPVLTLIDEQKRKSIDKDGLHGRLRLDKVGGNLQNLRVGKRICAEIVAVRIVGESSRNAKPFHTLSFLGDASFTIVSRLSACASFGLFLS